MEKIEHEHRQTVEADDFDRRRQSIVSMTKNVTGE